ncbi:MAG TPA: ATP-binding protein [Acidimicrobiia bacterium]|nr:ATP-binding protein [Acidimicrobiia bacterium]
MGALTTRIRGRHVAETGAPLVGLAIGDPLSAFRASVLRRSVPLLLVVVAILAAVARFDGHRLDMASAAFFGATLAGLGLATRVPWERAAATPGSWAAWLWSIIVATVLGGLALVPGLAASTRPLLAAVVVMTGLVLDPVRHAFVTVLTIGLVAASYLTGSGFRPAEMVGPLMIVAVTAVAVAFATRQLERTAISDRHHMADLEAERAAYERLYDVASTLGASGSLQDTLPVLLHRLSSYLDSSTGAWLVADQNSGMLRVVPPVVLDGESIELQETVEVRMRDSSFASKALRSERPVSIRVDSLKIERRGVLGKLGIGVAMAAPLIVEGQRVGVVLVGNPEKGEYTERDLEELRVLSAPAGLVLAQLRRQQEAEELTQRLREVAEMKTDFVSVVSHELRTPLTSIRGALDTLVRPGLIEENTVVSELIGSARRQSTRLERLIDDLLVASRLDRGTMRSTLRPVSIVDVVDEVVPLVAYDRIRVDVDPDDVIAADPDQFTQVVRNLVENAVKYGGGSDIDVSVVREHGGLTLVVADHGPGIPAEDRDRVFDRFVQLQRPDRRSQEGSGLGLAIVKALVDAMGGRIVVGETPGGGATFRVSFRAASSVDLRPLTAGTV